MGPCGLPKGSYGQRGTLGKLICDLLSQACYRVAWESSSELRIRDRGRGGGRDKEEANSSFKDKMHVIFKKKKKSLFKPL